MALSLLLGAHDGVHAHLATLSSCLGLSEGKICLASRVSCTRHQPWPELILASGQALVCRPGHAARMPFTLRSVEASTRGASHMLDGSARLDWVHRYPACDNQLAAKQRKCVPRPQGACAYMTCYGPRLPRLTLLSPSLDCGPPASHHVASGPSTEVHDKDGGVLPPRTSVGWDGKVHTDHLLTCSSLGLGT